jgi:hypothetical protein
MSSAGRCVIILSWVEGLDRGSARFQTIITSMLGYTIITCLQCTNKASRRGPTRLTNTTWTFLGTLMIRHAVLLLFYLCSPSSTVLSPAFCCHGRCQTSKLPIPYGARPLGLQPRISIRTWTIQVIVSLDQHVQYDAVRDSQTSLDFLFQGVA